MVGNKLQNANLELIKQKRKDYQVLSIGTIQAMYKVYEELYPNKNEISYFQEVECKIDVSSLWSPENYIYIYKNQVITQVRIEGAKGMKVK